MLSALAWLLMYVSFPIIPAAPFLEYDPSELVALVAGFAIGPLAGVLVVLLKNALHMLTNPEPIGHLANFLAGATLVFVLASIYRLKKTRLVAGASLVAGSLAMTAVMAIANRYFFLPIWGVPSDQVAGLIASAIVPFNLAKAGMSSLVTFFVYKRVRKLVEIELAAPVAARQERVGR